MKDDQPNNSHYLTHTFLFRKVGRMYCTELFTALYCFVGVEVRAQWIAVPSRSLFPESRSSSCSVFTSSVPLISTITGEHPGTRLRPQSPQSLGNVPQRTGQRPSPTHAPACPSSSLVRRKRINGKRMETSKIND